MLSYVFVAAVLAATTYAAYCDWRTTEVSDFVSLVIGGIALLYYLIRSIGWPIHLTDLYFMLGTLCFVTAVGTYLRIHLLPGEQSRDAFADMFVEHTAAPMDTYQRLERLYRGMGRFWYGVGQAYAVMYRVIEPALSTIPEQRRPDILGTGILLLSAVLYYAGMQAGGVQPIVLSVAAGTALFSMGWGMYLAGMWGGADAFVLGALGYAFPVLPITVRVVEPMFPVPLLLVMTVFFVGAIYSLLYAIGVAVRNDQVVGRLRQDLRENRFRAGGLILSGIIVILGMVVAAHTWMDMPLWLAMQGGVILFGLSLFMTVIYIFLRAVETDVMHRTVPVEELQEGDVLAQGLDEVPVDGKKIVGLTAEQIDAIQDQYDEVEIRSGVQFIVAYPFAVILLILLGDPLAVLIEVML